jgi:hypothetical protein
MLTAEQRAVLAHVVVDPDAWYENAVTQLGEEQGHQAMLDKVERWSAEYAVESVKPGYMTRAQREQVSQDRPITADDYERVIQLRLDAHAQSWGYDNIFTACTYAEEPSVPQFQAEGQALRVWRSEVWSAAYTILSEVQGGQRAAPTLVGIIDELPAAPARP